MGDSLRTVGLPPGHADQGQQRGPLRPPRHRHRVDRGAAHRGRRHGPQVDLAPRHRRARSDRGGGFPGRLGHGGGHRLLAAARLGDRAGLPVRVRGDLDPAPGDRGGQGPGGHRHTPHPAGAARRERLGRPPVRRNHGHPPRRRPRHRPRHLRAGVGATVPAGAAAAQRVHPSARADAPRGDRAPHADGTGARAGADPGPSAGVGMRGRPVRGGDRLRRAEGGVARGTRRPPGRRRRHGDLADGRRSPAPAGRPPQPRPQRRHDRGRRPGGTALGGCRGPRGGRRHAADRRRPAAHDGRAVHRPGACRQQRGGRARRGRGGARRSAAAAGGDDAGHPRGAQAEQGPARDTAGRGRRAATLAGADRTHRAAPRHPARRRHARRYRRRGVHRAASVRPGGLRQRHRDRRVELGSRRGGVLGPHVRRRLDRPQRSGPHPSELRQDLHDPAGDRVHGPGGPGRGRQHRAQHAVPADVGPAAGRRRGWRRRRAGGSVLLLLHPSPDLGCARRHRAARVVHPAGHPVRDHPDRS